MSWRAFVENDWMNDGVKIGLAEIGEQVSTYIRFDNTVFEQVLRDGSTRTEYEPLRLPEAAARALLDALLQQFRMTRADENLRVDYLAERARVDKLLDSQIAARPMPVIIEGRIVND